MQGSRSRNANCEVSLRPAPLLQACRPPRPAHGGRCRRCCAHSRGSDRWPSGRSARPSGPPRRRSQRSRACAARAPAPHYPIHAGVGPHFRHQPPHPSPRWRSISASRLSGGRCSAIAADRAPSRTPEPRSALSGEMRDRSGAAEPAWRDQWPMAATPISRRAPKPPTPQRWPPRSHPERHRSRTADARMRRPPDPQVPALTVGAAWGGGRFGAVGKPR